MMNKRKPHLRDPLATYTIRDMDTLKAWLDYPDERKKEFYNIPMIAVTEFANHVRRIKVPKKDARKQYKRYPRSWTKEEREDYFPKSTVDKTFEPQIISFALPHVKQTHVEGPVTPEMKDLMSSYIINWMDSIKRFETYPKNNAYMAYKREWRPEDLLKNLIANTKLFPPDWKKEMIELCYAQLSDRPKWIKYMMEEQDIWYYSNTECALIDRAKSNDHRECYVAPNHTPDIEKAINTHITPIGQWQFQATKWNEYYIQSHAAINILLRVKDAYPEILTREPSSMSRAWLFHFIEHLQKVVHQKERTWPELKSIWDAQGVTHTFQQWIAIEENKHAMLTALNDTFVKGQFRGVLRAITQLLNMDSNIYFFEGLSYLTNIPFDRENIDELSAKKEQLESLNPNMNMVDLYETLCKPIALTSTEEYSLDF